MAWIRHGRLMTGSWHLANLLHCRIPFVLAFSPARVSPGYPWCCGRTSLWPVSYTHLTLPTICSV
eukprot:1560977-Alexandrium_andersonii.AAC.1